MATLNNINTLLMQLQTHAATIGLTLAAVMISIYAMKIMLSQDGSAMADRTRWEGLQKVLICAGIIAATGVLLQFVEGLGKML